MVSWMHPEKKAVSRLNSDALVTQLPSNSLQYSIYKIRNNVPQNKNGVMVGKNAIIALCMLGLISNNIYFLSAVIGLAIADEIGKIMGWSK